MKPRSVAIPKSFQNFNFSSAFSAFGYPAMGVIALIVAIVVGALMTDVALRWWYLPLALGVVTLAIVICNMGIGGLHRIIQHRAGEMKWPAQIITMINLIIAMQGEVKDWVNYHSQHHRFADKPGDPHNPFESKRWAWVGWILFRDQKDMARPMPMWLKNQPVIVWMDWLYRPITIGIHFVIPAIVYALVWYFGGSIVLAMIVHASLIIGRAIQFHATVYGINVLGHLKTPLWADYVMALLTGGEAFHDHHHDEPQSALHLPRKGIWNRIVDYNGTMLLAFEKLGWVKNLKIAPQFA